MSTQLEGRYFLSQDDSSHWYMVPSSERELWNRLLEEACETEDWDEFEMEFARYRTGEGISGIDFSIEMPVDQYVQIALKTYKSTGDRFKDLTHYVSALAEEAGEACAILKRHCRGDFDFFNSEEEQQRMLKELGDVLWYVNAIAHFMGSSLEEVMNMNNEKLLKRLADGKIMGRGDNR